MEGLSPLLAFAVRPAVIKTNITVIWGNCGRRARRKVETENDGDALAFVRRARGMEGNIERGRNRKKKREREEEKVMQ